MIVSSYYNKVNDVLIMDSGLTSIKNEKEVI